MRSLLDLLLTEPKHRAPRRAPKWCARCGEPHAERYCDLVAVERVAANGKAVPRLTRRSLASVEDLRP